VIIVIWGLLSATPCDFVSDISERSAAETLFQGIYEFELSKPTLTEDRVGDNILSEIAILELSLMFSTNSEHV
jgi:hypothetical protein